MKKIVKRTVAVIILAFFVIALLFTVQRLMGNPFPTLFGYGIAQVQSGSMEPVIHVGDVVFVDRNVPLQEHDIFMYSDERNRLITHRIVQMEDDALIAKGDANAMADTPISKNQVIGKIIYHCAPPLNFIKGNTVVYFSANLILFLLAAWAVQWSLKECKEIIRRFMARKGETANDK